MGNPGIPVILVDQSAFGALSIFNRNDWHPRSRGVIESCATKLSLLKYSRDRITSLCASATQLCQSDFDTLNAQWKVAPWDAAKVGAYYGQVPELHVVIEGFFAGLKGLLDLSVQLLTTEGIVKAKLHGFHRTGKKNYGGRVLNALNGNVASGKSTTATQVRDLITTHKDQWIDGAIDARDALIHPGEYLQQVMLTITVDVADDGQLVYREAVPPPIGGVSIAEYADARVHDIVAFCEELLATLRDAV